MTNGRVMTGQSQAAVAGARSSRALLFPPNVEFDLGRLSRPQDTDRLSRWRRRSWWVEEDGKIIIKIIKNNGIKAGSLWSKRAGLTTVGERQKMEETRRSGVLFGRARAVKQ